MDCTKLKIFALGSILKKIGTLYDVRSSATKTDCFSKKSLAQKKLFCQCGTGRIYFHWSNLFLLFKSIFTGQIYFVKYLRYVPVPQKLIFSKNPSLKKGSVCQCGTDVDSMNRLGTF